MMLFALVAQEPVLSLFLGLLVMVLIGSIIIWVVGALIFFIPAAVVAGVVWFLTADPNFAGAAFLLIAVLSILKR